ncbi:MAG: hypothetical protein COA79_05315 [Planctomycetota bacterium]|nr:MAG: hypothetical protein COA79_05315 [Planctomycetota bacterium]
MKKIFYIISIYLIIMNDLLFAGGRRDAVASYHQSKSGINDTVLYTLSAIGIALVGAVIYFVITKKKN